ncbi:MAG: ribonuclease III [Cyanobacteria bacterium Co-bin13]|nr:ribonuclease III [Cyanobacteria bacterium Co-bin13]
MASEDTEKVDLSLQMLVRLRDVLVEPGAPMSLSNGQVQALSPIALAYIGDAVYELFVRGFFLTPPCRIQAYHEKVVSQVRAEQQSHHLSKITPYLTLDEQDILRKGRNASPRGPRRIDSQVYQQATSFETLIGYLYLTDPRRLTELFSHVDLTSSGSSSP